jgi:hypothetical protein
LREKKGKNVDAKKLFVIEKKKIFPFMFFLLDGKSTKETRSLKVPQ